MAVVRSCCEMLWLTPYKRSKPLFLIIICITVYTDILLKILLKKFRGREGLRQVFMALIDWATHVLQ